MVMDINEILKILPHRYPFILIDRIISMDQMTAGSWVGRKCVAIKNVTMNEPFFSGHFPGKPVMPGVLMIEAMAQAAGLCAYKPPEGSNSMEVLIAGIDNARFRRMVIPGDTLKITVEIIKERGTIFSFHCEAHVENELACEADILAKSFFKKV